MDTAFRAPIPFVFAISYYTTRAYKSQPTAQGILPDSIPDFSTYRPTAQLLQWLSSKVKGTFIKICKNRL